MKELFVYSFMIFFICSFFGYFMEVFWVFLGTKKLVNRGFLCGPVIPIYGFGALLIIFALSHYSDEALVVFVFGVILTSLLEYFISYLLEKIFHNKWWDYSNRKYNLNGRICLQNSIAFGLLSLFIIYVLEPLFAIIFSWLPFRVWDIIATILFVIFILDTIYSVIIAYNLRNRIIIVEELKNEKIAMIPILFEKRLRESIENFKAFPGRLLKAFPDLEKSNHKYYEIMKNYRDQKIAKRKAQKKEIKETKKANKKKKR